MNNFRYAVFKNSNGKIIIGDVPTKGFGRVSEWIYTDNKRYNVECPTIKEAEYYIRTGVVMQKKTETIPVVKKEIPAEEVKIETTTSIEISSESEIAKVQPKKRGRKKKVLESEEETSYSE